MAELSSQLTRDVIAEADVPSVQASGSFRAALSVFRPALNRVSQQAARYQELVGVARDVEAVEGIRQKYTGLEMACASAQAKHDKALDALNQLRGAHESLDQALAELRNETARVDAGGDTVRDQ